MLQKLNNKLIVLHLAGTILMVFAFKALSYLYDPELMELYLKEPKNLSRIHGIDKRISYFRFVLTFAPLAGVLVSYLFSTVNIKRNGSYSRWNATAVFAIALVLAAIGLYNLSLLETTFFAPGRLIFSSLTSIYIVNYTYLLVLGSWFLLPGTIDKLLKK